MKSRALVCFLVPLSTCFAPILSTPVRLHASPAVPGIRVETRLTEFTFDDRGVIVAGPAIVFCPGGARPGVAAGEPQTATNGDRRFGAFNPAAAYCVELGYAYELFEAADGHRGVCVLPNGERVDAWDFFRGTCGQQFSYCARQGYATSSRRPSTGAVSTAAPRSRTRARAEAAGRSGAPRPSSATS